jgi:hypothetical protein
MTIRLRETGVTWQEVGDSVIALDLDGSVYLKLNGSGKVLWERLQQPTTPDDLTQALVERYGIDENQATADAQAFVNELRRRQLLAE